MRRSARLPAALRGETTGAAIASRPGAACGSWTKRVVPDVVAHVPEARVPNVLVNKPTEPRCGAGTKTASPQTLPSSTPMGTC